MEFCNGVPVIRILKEQKHHLALNVVTRIVLGGKYVQRPRLMKTF